MSVAWRLETIIFLEHVGLDVDAALQALCEEAGDPWTCQWPGRR
jgi:hypothetical protein